MTNEQIFIASTSFFIVAFTVLLLWFAWDAVRAWRAEKSKTKRIEAVIDDTEYFTPNWEREIHRINRRCAGQRKDAMERHNQTIADLKQRCLDELFDLHKLRNKEEAEVDETAQ